MEEIQHERRLSSNDVGFMCLLRSFQQQGSFLGSHDSPVQSHVSNIENSSTQLPNLFPLPNDERFEVRNNFDEQPDSQSSEYSSENLSNEEEDFDDPGPAQYSNISVQPYNERVMKFFNDVRDGHDDDIPDPEDNIRSNFWSEREHRIRIGIHFQDKSELKKAIALWSVTQNRESKVVESKCNTWVAKCKSAEENDGEGLNNTCEWYVRAQMKKSINTWQITRWVETRNCIGACVDNDNRNLTSTMIASHIRHSIENDHAYPVKSIQADVKNYLNVDISYKKAWYEKKKAIDTVYGDWKSNFDVLPSYIAALEASNPNTVVKWFHHPSSSSNILTFKYIFWAFGPAIDAFHQCRPVICIDGTHLRGDYKGKMLVAVTKDANNHILPIAYAIVDEETNHSWCWFLQQFRYFIARDKHLRVVSDRHRGIINAMSTLDEWKEPLGYHRFCLRHIRSNFNTRFKNSNLKRLCWLIGSTTQKRKFKRYKSEMKNINPAAWQYLKGIDKS